jgi:hypothetical protein
MSYDVISHRNRFINITGLRVVESTVRRFIEAFSWPVRDELNQRHVGAVSPAEG